MQFTEVIALNLGWVWAVWCGTALLCAVQSARCVLHRGISTAKGLDTAQESAAREAAGH